MDAGGPSSDPALFFTPEKSLPPSHHPELSPQPLKATGTVPAQRAFFILAPHIADEEKKLYKPAEASSLKHDSEMLLDEVIGHYREHDISYYYARYQGGLAHKFFSTPFLRKFKHLVDEFNRKDAAGELEPFDPSAHYIHPSSRVKFTVSINNRRATVNISSARSIKSVSGLETVPDSEEEKRTDVDDESDNDESDFEEEEQSFRRRTSGRVSVTRKQTLPFSPKKTRSARVFVIDSDLETGASDKNVTIIPTRRSSRNTKRNRKELKDLDSDDSDADLISYSDADAYAPRTPHTKAKPKKLMGKRESRPAYGHFRSIADLDYDSHSDEETAPMRKHRNICEKCHQPPAHKLLKALSRRGKGRSKKKKTEDEFEESGDEEEKLAGLGGWVRCLKCPVVAHWKCMASVQREEILKAARDRERAEWERNQSHDGDPTPEPAKRSGLTPDQTTEFICGACMKGGFCMFCMEVALEADSVQKEKACSAIKDKATTDDPKENSTLPQSSASENTTDGHCSTKQLLFRCLTCKRLAHYAHLPPSSHNPSRETIAEIAQHYTQTWLCADCASYTFGVDKVIAWRPYPPTVVEPTRDETANYKSFLPREYLVKWIDRSFRRVQWVPHMWLLSTHPAKLKNFLMGGSKVELMKTPDIAELDGDEPDSSDLNHERRASSVNLQANASLLPQNPIPDAERRIPPAWKTVDRLLDVLLWRSQPHHSKQKQKRKGKRRQFSIGTDGSEDDLDEDIEEERELAFDRGEQPSDNLVETVSDWETRTGYRFSEENIRQIAWALIKWEDLGYDEASWDSPPRPNDPTYSAFESALRRYVHSRGVVVPKHSMSYCEKFDKRAKDQYRTRHALKDAADLDIGQDQQLKLMPFQVDGFNWLCNNWWNLQPCILADEMGLGKTVQVATFLGSIVAKFKAFPALVVVPNSTITNWVREFERWAPDLRVVPFYGEAKSREIIKKYELYHQIKRTHETGAKFHVLIATYEALLNPKDFTPVFRNQPRWEVLIIDEGQRLKSDSSLLFKRLNELKSIQRILMTGTPLNNNIRELFNLMNFLDPNEWNDLEGLEKEHEELTEDLVKQLHNRLRPYFLRRLKSEVLQLPPKNEVIVPISMAPLQKEVYRSILSNNLELLNGLTRTNSISAPSKGRIKNVLMQLRKCLQHPYLYAEDIEPRGLLPQESHEKLIDGSGKLRFLKTLLPKLKERGHRVLLFSQFVIALDVIEDFLNGEGLKYLRLDGNTKSKDRQKGMDEFNKPGSEIFIYLLTTRAGGVGINLFSADTVIIYDPDFNPHQDLQAIARAYRFGQQKTCLVFKLMIKDSAEERIMQVGKKKLVLDHLIVQKMDEEDSAGEDVQSILTYGAQTLFDSDQSSRDIVYSEQDIERLVEKTEQEGEKQEPVKEGMSFSFAKVWAADKDSLEEVEDIDQGDSWAQTLQKITADRDKVPIQETALSGRGVKRRAAAISKPNAYRDEPLNGAPNSVRSVKSSVDSEGSGYFGSEIDSDIEEDGEDGEDEAFEPSQPKPKKLLPTEPLPLAPIHSSRVVQFCGLCGTRHGDGPGECVMTEKSENLAEFREMLMLHADDEPWEQRTAAIDAIDRTLYQRGHIQLVVGQPLRPLRKTESSPVRQDMSPANATTEVPTAGMSAVQRDPLPSSASSNEVQSQPQLPSHGSRSNGENAIASSSKRPVSPTTVEQGKAKKTKTASASSLPCPVCERMPHHLIKNCPLVIDGPQSITKQIVRLEKNFDNNSAAAVRVLRKLLSKGKRKERAGDDANVPIHIDLSD
ncbi:hypothetical protein H2248_001042 [Termitomyces sp. 'cryptogamus']|nr:hypothetical protein H2248_001042 [Termitomyces sp. 'cryptogamus']